MKVGKFFRVPIVKGADVGVEIEVEGRRLPKAGIPSWNVERDGSLRGDDNAEYVLATPVSLKHLRTKLTRLTYHFKEAGAEVDFSRRTSTHVHINCTEMEMLHLFNFLTLLFIFEEFLVGWCEEHRSGNLFCLQSKDAEGVYDSLRSFAGTRDRRYLRDNIRYSAINLAALGKYGTVELRSLEGTVDTDRIETWCNVMCHLRDKAEVFKNPRDIMENMSELEPVKFANEMLGEYSRTLFVGKGRNKKIIEAVRRVQDTVYTIEWDLWDDDKQADALAARQEAARKRQEAMRIEGVREDLELRQHVIGARKDAADKLEGVPPAPDFPNFVFEIPHRD